MKIKATLRTKLQNLRASIGANIIGQDHVLDEIVAVLHQGELGMTSPRRPKGSFLFLGPTGVGKTETALVFTHYLFGSGHLARIDMSEFQLQESLTRLLGHDGQDRGLIGQRFAEIGNTGTFLFDEIEKAHPRVIDILLQILDEARVTLADGTTLDFSQCYVVLTSNIASHAMLKAANTTRATRKRLITAEAMRVLRPETFARITSVSVFDPLSHVHRDTLVRLLVKRELEHLGERGHSAEISEENYQEILCQGYDRRLGARPLRHVVERYLRGQVVNDLLTADPRPESFHESLTDPFLSD